MATDYTGITTHYIGRPTSRVDGRANVTGEAKYAAEYNVPNLAYGYVVSSEIAKGKITKIDAERARALPGVLQVFTHENHPSIAWFDRSYKDEVSVPGSPFRPLYDDKIKSTNNPSRSLSPKSSRSRATRRRSSGSSTRRSRTRLI
jgi:xanthine dehydrogenase YagR molybdenum-binding subunit